LFITLIVADNFIVEDVPVYCRW